MNAYGQAEGEIKESGNELFGANTSPEVREKTMQSRLFRNKTEKGKALSVAKGQETIAKNNAYMGLGQATAPQLVQTGGTSVQKQSGVGTWLAPIIGGAAQVGSAAVTAGMAPGAS